MISATFYLKEWIMVPLSLSEEKVEIKSHVYFEAVRSNFMQGTLNFLKLNKLFLAAIDINIRNISPE